MTLLDKIQNHSAVIGIVGLGYVGFPLAVLQAKTGYRVIGIDEDAKKVDQVNKEKSYIDDVPDKDLAQALGTKHFSGHHRPWSSRQV